MCVGGAVVWLVLPAEVAAAAAVTGCLDWSRGAGGGVSMLVLVGGGVCDGACPGTGATCFSNLLPLQLLLPTLGP